MPPKEKQPKHETPDVDDLIFEEDCPPSER